MDKLSKKGLEGLYHKHHLHRLWDFLSPHAKNSIRITPKRTEEHQIPIGQSKLGGTPDLPKDVEWFKYNEKSMAFVAQINLSEVTKLDIENTLPKSGILYFFYDAELDCLGDHPNHKGACKVFYYEGAFSQLESKERPEDLEEYSFFNSCIPQFNNVITIPEIERSSLGVRGFTLEKSESHQLSDLQDELDCINREYYYGNDASQFDTDMFDNETIKLLGHASNVNYEPEYLCDLVTNGYEGFDDPRSKEFEGDYRDWHLLFQVGSSKELDVQWSYEGHLYYWIKEKDLQNKKFENTWGVIQDWSC